MVDSGDLPAERADPAGETEQRLRHRLELEFGSRRDWDDRRANGASSLGAARDVLLGPRRCRRRIGRRGSDQPRRRLVAPGLMVIPIILFMGAISGAYLNPGVSLALPWRDPLEARARLHHHSAHRSPPGVPLPPGGVREHPAPRRHSARRRVSNWQALLMEIALTAGLVSVILGTASAAQNVGR